MRHPQVQLPKRNRDQYFLQEFPQRLMLVSEVDANTFRSACEWALPLLT